MGEILGGCSEPRNSKCYNRPVRPNSVMREFSLKDKESNANHRLKVQAFLILERLASPKDLLVSVLLQAEGQFFGKTSLGTVAEGREALLSALGPAATTFCGHRSSSGKHANSVLDPICTASRRSHRSVGLLDVEELRAELG
jgi:hypothetical protein